MVDLREYSVNTAFKLQYGYSDSQIHPVNALEQRLKDAEHQVRLINSHKVGKIINSELIFDLSKSISNREKLLADYVRLNADSKITYSMDKESGIVSVFYKGELYYPKNSKR